MDFFGVLGGLKNDLDNIPKAYGLRHYNAYNFCDLCEAIQPGEGSKPHVDYNPAMAFTNFRPKAAWKRTCHTVDSWRALYTVLHIIFDLPGVSHHMLEPDELHVMHLGSSSYLLGSILWLLCYRLLPSSPSENLKRVWACIVNAYRDNGVPSQYTNMSLSMFTNPDSPDKSYPKLKGRGAEIKELVQPLLFAWEALVDCSDDFNHDVKAILETQIDIQTILHIHRDDTFLPVKVANRLRDCVDRFLSLYQGLAHASDQRKDLLFNMVPKLHWLWHLGQKAIFLNPRKGNTMVDEDYVGFFKKNVQACAQGTPSASVSLACMDKYCWGLHFLNVYGNAYSGQ